MMNFKKEDSFCAVSCPCLPFISAVIPLGLILVLQSCGESSEASSETTDGSLNKKGVEVTFTRKTIQAMGTRFTLSVPEYVDNEKLQRAVSEAFDEIRRVNTLMTAWDPKSHLSKVNAANGTPVVVPQEIINVVNEAKRISKLTNGKFDISFYGLGDLWRFKEKPPKLPDPDEVKRRLPLVDYRNILVDKSQRTIQLGKPGMGISLGAIAKGYGVDRAAKVLKAHGISDFIVYGGGDIMFGGQKRGNPWAVGVQDPRDPNSYYARFEVDKECSVVTSGEYEKFFIVDGKRYHHIIDPDTGYPAKGTVSVTVVAQNTVTADAMATGIFVLGPQAGMALFESQPHLEGIIVDTNLKVHISSGLKNKVKLALISEKEPTHPLHI